ncbi:MAG TPA: hypothetical protein VK915_08000 [Gaiellaceae bacterium]|nr:hypothetical protein [Gaiellaceae bacterium]
MRRPPGLVAAALAALLVGLALPGTASALELRLVAGEFGFVTR